MQRMVVMQRPKSHGDSGRAGQPQHRCTIDGQRHSITAVASSVRILALLLRMVCRR